MEDIDMKGKLQQLQQTSREVVRAIDASNQLVLAAASDDKVSRSLVAIGGLGTVVGGTAMLMEAWAATATWVKVAFIAGGAAMTVGFARGLQQGFRKASRIAEARAKVDAMKERMEPQPAL